MIKSVYKHGIENVSSAERIISGCRVGLITNPTGCTRELIPTADVLRGKCDLTCLYAPEHGITGAVQAGGKVENERDPHTGLPVYSLFGKKEGDPFENVDVVVFDMQDVGVRFYTYLYVLTYAMQKCAESGKPVVVCDRYDPIGGKKIEGTLLDERFSSGVGRFALPSRYGLTIGEFARFINKEKNIGCDLHVAPCLGLTRSVDFRTAGVPWVMPSPNIPTYETALCYVGTVVFEGTNVSEGRGTTKPFEMIGAPWIDPESLVTRMRSYGFDGVLFRRADFIPTFSKHAGSVCHGVSLHVTDPDAFEPFTVGLVLMDEIRKSCEEFEFLCHGSSHFIDLLLGTDEARAEDFSPLGFVEKEKKKIISFAEKFNETRLYD